jgi:hypothetical protein
MNIAYTTNSEKDNVIICLRWGIEATVDEDYNKAKAFINWALKEIKELEEKT